MQAPGVPAAPPVVCVDRRLLHAPPGTGVASYADALRRSLPAAGYGAEALVDAGAQPSPQGRARRWAAAMHPGTVWTTAPHGHPTGCHQRLATDVFRRAQVHFDIYGRYLSLRGPAPPRIMHWSYPLPLHFAGVPNLYTVHDLIPLLQPTLTSIRPERTRRMLDRLRRQAAHLVTVSEASRSDIIATLGWPPDQVTNTYLGVDLPDPASPTLRAAGEAAMQRAGITRGGYFLHVGTVETRKNIARLLQAYRASGSARALVLAGPDGWGSAQALAGSLDLLTHPGAASAAATGPHVVRLPWSERDALLGLIHGAAAVLAPSLAEGFGIAAIEAMGLGTPVLTSATGAPREITGGAALLVDPADVNAIAAAIAALDHDAGLRAQLSAAGLVRARMFGLEAYAGRLAALYGTVLRAHSAV